MASPPSRPIAATSGAVLLLASLCVTAVTAANMAGSSNQEGNNFGNFGNSISPQRVNQDAQIVADFAKRAQEYVDLHRKLERTLPPRPAQPTPQEADTHQRSLARLISQARGRAKHGDMLTRDSHAYFRRQIARAMS
ncbi:MAG: hypothetical protein ACREUZ_10710, partial [Burkholderiales bacterium]